MSFTHAIVWLDHAEAHVIHLDETEHAAQHVRSPHGKEHLHHKRGSVAAGKAPVHNDFFVLVATAIGNASEIVIVGPAQAKLDFYKFLGKHAANTAEQVLGVETVDHPSDGQLAAFARKYFRAADRMRSLEG